MIRIGLALLSILNLVACEQRSGEAVVLAKEYIAAAVTEATPGHDSNAEPAMVQAPADGEITVDSYVMKPEVRGTGRDPRALKDEQWLVKVRMGADSRIFNVPAEKSQFEKLKAGDRVQVRYRVGKYTKTVWGAEITSIGR